MTDRFPNLDKYRRILDKRPPRGTHQDLSWTVGEYQAAKPSIERAETAADNAARVNEATDRYIESQGGFDAVVAKSTPFDPFEGERDD